MASSIAKVSEKLAEIKDQFDDNGELVEAILENENSEDLLIALGMALAFNEGAITVNKTGEKHLRAALTELNEICEEFEDGDD